MTLADGHPIDVRLVEDVPSLEAEWSALAQRSRNVFVTPEWAETWREHYAPEAQLRLLACRDREGALRALWPLYVMARGPVRVARLAGHGPADELGPACAPEDRAFAAHALRAALAERRLGGQALLAERLAGDLDWPALLGGRAPHREARPGLPIARGRREGHPAPPSRVLGGRALHREASPVIPIAGRSWEDYLASQSRNFREQAGRRRRKLEREHAIEIAMTSDSARLGDDMDTLVGLHEQRWAGGESDS